MPDNRNTTTPETHNQPDPADSYERARPGTQPGMGRMDKTDNTPHAQRDDAHDSIHNNESHMEKTADDTQDLTDAVDPSDPHPHAGRPDAAKHPEAHQPGMQPGERKL